MDRKELLAALTLAHPALGTSSGLLPILSHFCFVGNQIVAYNEVTAILVDFPTKLKCAIHGPTLLGVLNATASDKVEFKSDNKGVVQIDAGTGWVKLPTLHENQFVFTQPEEKTTFSIPLTDEVVKAIEKCLLSIGTDTLRPEFLGVTVSVEKDATFLFSSDNRTASRVKLEKTVSKKPAAVVIPEIACKLILKLKASGGSEKVNIQIGEKAAIVSFSDVKLITRLLPAAPEKFAKVFSTHEQKESIDIPKELRQELNKASVLLSKSGEDCSITFTKGTIKIELSNTLGSMQSEIKCKALKSEGTLLIEPDCVLRALQHVDKMAVVNGRSLVLSGDGFTHIIASGTKAVKDMKLKPTA